MQPQAQDVKNSLNGISSKASSVANQAVSAAAPIATELSDRYEAARDYAVESYDSTVDYVKANPGKSLLAAAAVGVIAGFLLRRRK